MPEFEVDTWGLDQLRKFFDELAVGAEDCRPYVTRGDQRRDGLRGPPAHRRAGPAPGAEAGPDEDVSETTGPILRRR